MFIVPRPLALQSRLHCVEPTSLSCTFQNGYILSDRAEVFPNKTCFPLPLSLSTKNGCAWILISLQLGKNSLAHEMRRRGNERVSVRQGYLGLLVLEALRYWEGFQSTPRASAMCQAVFVAVYFNSPMCALAR
jgi:hypothetical protein